MIDEHERKAREPEPGGQSGEDESSTEQEGSDDHLHEDQKTKPM